MKNLSFLILAVVAGLMLGCGAPTPNGNSNTTISNNSNLNININSNVTSTNTNANSTTTTSGVDAKEPEVYQATVTLKFETLGNQKMPLPALQANVARNGEDRRMEFSLPGNEKLIYLDKGGKQFVISPTRKQYAELTKEALGFEVRRMLMPGEIVNQVKNIKGVERVGEEQMNGRTVIKYRYGATANTGSQAGQVNTESFVYVDKETNLPIRSETVSQSTGNVQGMNGLKVGTEMSNITTTADPSLFAEPTDYKKVEPEQVKQQANMLFSAAAAIVAQLMRSAQAPPMENSAPQATSPTPTPTQ